MAAEVGEEWGVGHQVLLISFGLRGRLGHLKQPALSAGHRHLFDYPTPSLLNFLWGFGSLCGIGLQVQIVTGIVLAMHYTPHVVCAGVSIEHILRSVVADLSVGLGACVDGHRILLVLLRGAALKRNPNLKEHLVAAAASV